MNLHQIEDGELAILLEYCMARFSQHWHWRIAGNSIEYSTDRSFAAGTHSMYHTLHIQEMNEFKQQVPGWVAQGKPILR